MGVGAGAAGIWAAARAARLGAEVLLLEKTPRVGTKVLASGGSRCNLTTTLAPSVLWYVPLSTVCPRRTNALVIIGSASRYAPSGDAKVWHRKNWKASPEMDGWSMRIRMNESRIRSLTCLCHCSL